MKNLVLVGRVILGAWMVINGANHFFGPFYAEPVGTTPLAMQFMAALNHSGLIQVVMAAQLVLGAVILSGFYTPVALCMLMPISTCAAYWAVILEHEPVGAATGVVLIALNGFLMLAYIDYYRGVLQRHAPTLGEV